MALYTNTEPMNATIQAKVTTTMRKKLEALARQEGRPMGHFVRMWIEQGLHSYNVRDLHNLLHSPDAHQTHRSHSTRSDDKDQETLREV